MNDMQCIISDLKWVAKSDMPDMARGTLHDIIQKLESHTDEVYVCKDACNYG